MHLAERPCQNVACTLLCVTGSWCESTFRGISVLVKGTCQVCQGGEPPWIGCTASQVFLPGLVVKGAALDGLCCQLKVVVGSGRWPLWRNTAFVRSTGEPGVG